ncbi:MAG TPA: sensor histidine kinase [Verrucomicrobiae bacterium]|nr:sensor histidine kinase [Verrucomicrobiae bacterium]
MARKHNGIARRYAAALGKHLKQGPQSALQPARRLGRQAMFTGLETLDLARIHERALVALVLPSYSPGTRDTMVRRAGAFFAEVITPIEKTHRTAREANLRLTQMIGRLHRRSADLKISNRRLKKEVVQRRLVEESLRNSERHYSKLLEQSQVLQEQLRHLSRQLLLAQEEERKRISRELHDEIAQTLTSINVRLAALKIAATVNTKDLQEKISSTQRMVEKSVDIVHRFARELRPTVLDDLGLIPALHTFVKSFSKRSRVHVRLTVYAAVEQLDSVKRTVLYRVVQEALTNVARHAHASRVDVSIHKLQRAVGVTIKDDGKSFQVSRMLDARKNKRLGLLGMRERVEMVGGSFHVESAPGKGTTIRAQIPFTNGRAGGGGGKLANEVSARTKV